jgi:putative endonuclease
MQAAKHVVYILKSAHDPPHYYVGVTAAPSDRLADHNSGRCFHTSRHRPWALHVTISFAAEGTALRFERYLKSGSGREFARRHFE